MAWHSGLFAVSNWLTQSQFAEWQDMPDHCNLWTRGWTTSWCCMLLFESRQGIVSWSKLTQHVLRKLICNDFRPRTCQPTETASTMCWATSLASWLFAQIIHWYCRNSCTIEHRFEAHTWSVLYGVSWWIMWTLSLDLIAILQRPLKGIRMTTAGAATEAL